MVFEILIFWAFVILIGTVYHSGLKTGRRVTEERFATAETLRKCREAEELSVAAAEADAAKDAKDQEGDEDQESVCLKVGTHVVCNLSEGTHTHGVLVGFAPATLDQQNVMMLAMVDVGHGSPLVPIDVDLVDPVTDERGPAPTYRDRGNNDPSRWN